MRVFAIAARTDPMPSTRCMPANPALLCASNPPEDVEEIVDEGEDDGNDHETEDS